jgi:myb proto-oncogene protein
MVNEVIMKMKFENSFFVLYCLCRTDNAVKNRFTTLCKKRAKHEAMAKENRIACCVNSDNKRLLFPDGISTPLKAESESPLTKKMR